MGIATVPTVLAAGAAVAAYALHLALRSWQRNIDAAKRSGFKYIVSPISPFGLVSQLTHKLWVPIVKACLPKSWWEDWITFLIADWPYTQNHAPFARHAHEALLVASPYDTVLLTDSPQLIRHVSRDRDAFPKPVDSYEVLRLFGDNVLASEGGRWKAHRRVTAGSFGERNAGLVFAVSVEQTGGLLRKWLADQGCTDEDDGGDGERTKGQARAQTGSKAVGTIDGDTMRLALNIIAYVGFGLKLSWPGEELAGDKGGQGSKYTALKATEGFTMSFVDAVANVLDLILYLLILPQWLLRILPFRKPRLAAEAYLNYKTYMEHLLTDKIAQIRSGASDAEPGMDIMGHLARSTYSPSSPCPFMTADDESSTPSTPAKPIETPPEVCPSATLSRSDIIGNAFIMLVAGHETTANALHFTLLELAAHPSAQRALQRDVDAVVGRDTDPSQWRYEEVVGPLLESMVGACMLETLRKMPSVVEIPKVVAPIPETVRGEGVCGRGGDKGRVVVVDGERRVLMPGTKISLVAAAAHRNPRYWPTRRSRITGKEHDLDDFVPERWFAKEAGPGEYDAPRDTSSHSGSAEEDTVWVKSPSTTTAGDPEPKESTDSEDSEDEGSVTGRLFRPERGAYIPFSDGPRSCLGRRIAQVEIVAVFAAIFQRYSLELAVDEWLPHDHEGKGQDVDAVVEGMSREERRALYRLAQERCREKIRGARSVLTLRMQSGQDVPVRLVRRGEEKFVSWME